MDYGSGWPLDFLAFCVNPAEVHCNNYPSLARAHKSSILYVNSLSNSGSSHISYEVSGQVWKA